MATCLSVCLLTVLLLVLDRLVDVQSAIRVSSFRALERPVIRLLPPAAEPVQKNPESDPVEEIQANEVRESVSESAGGPAVASVDAPAVQRESLPVKNWRSDAGDSIKAIVDSRIQREGIRASMWRRTGSVMFEPADEVFLVDDEPLLANFRFKPEVHVFGLGLTIGSCFIGLPIAGVPVEQRTVAITLFVCAGNST